MNIFLFKDYQVKPNTTGFLYRNNKFEKQLNPGYYKVFDWRDRTSFLALPITAKLLTITNQEVLTKDNIAFRFSFNIIYKIADGEKFLSNFALDRQTHYIILEAEQRLYNIVQLFIRNKVSEFDSEQLNEKRNELVEFKNEDMEKQAAEFGISIEQAQIRDITFPKSIQDLFAKQLEAKIRAKTDLENARTAVATARALKNASEIAKDDENIKFLQYLETITKIAQQGKHTFVVGNYKDIPPRS